MEEVFSKSIAREKELVVSEVAEQEKPQQTRKSVWNEIIDAIKGTEADYTKISMKRAIFLLAIPMVLELVMESTFAVADIYFVGKLGASAVATVGLTETYLFLLYSVAIGLSMAVTAIIARRVGERNREAAGISAVQSVFIALLCSVPFAIAGIFFSKELMALMGGDEWTLQNGFRYTRWMLGGNMVIMLLFIINAIFRGAGDAAIAMRILFISNLINIILDPVLIFGLGPFPELGIEGAAVATNIGRGTGVLVQLWMLFKVGKHIRVKWSHVRWDAEATLNLLKTSLGGVGQMIVAMTSWIFLMRILSSVGSEAVAGSTIALRIMMFTMMPVMGLANAATTLVGQNLGAGEPQRAETAIWRAGFYNMIFLFGVSLIFFIFNVELMSIFTSDEGVIRVGATWLRILSFSFFIYGWWMVSIQAFNGAGDTRTPTRINLVFFWFIQIPVSYLLAIVLDWGYAGVFWGVFISETSAGITSFFLFRRGKWKEMKV